MSIPYVCPRCLSEGSYTGVLHFPGQDEPVCKNHGKSKEQYQPMKPAKEVKRVSGV